ncbi:extracellular solute-binding protein [uncultured Clostridium sp.]|uniref:extracellular solute-binding protein n=1 Tax=uncultured Clostridium sp. TaxID=59620 RepID=UPI0025F2DFE5|nr:extracellular solute-binding protein [uncultured Clostridium sp.]
MIKSKRGLILGFLVLGAVAGCIGCGNRKAQTDNHIKISLYDFKMLGEYTDYVEAQVPDAEIEWSVGKNTLDFYTYLQKHDELPDIMTTRRFSVLDAQPLKDSLLDLSETELASSYHSVYLDKYRNEDGTVNWLPAPGIFDNLVANKALFEQYQIPLPTDYDSFVEACLAFEAKGIRGFASDYAYDYTSMEIIQGLSIEALSSLEGKTWRHEYENRMTAGLDDVVWPEAFERIQNLIDKGVIRADEADWDYYKVHEEFINNRIAVIRGTGAIASEAVKYDNMEVAALPYFGSSSEENWALTYPVFQIAVNHSAEEDENRKKLVMEVLNAMLNRDAQLILNEKIGAQISYNKDITLPLPEEMSQMEPLIKKNHIYIRIASNDFFKTSLDVFSGMVLGEYDAEQAYRVFDDSLNSAGAVPEQTVVTFEQSYPYAWDSEKGNAAGSSIANTVCKALGADVFVMPFYNVTCGVYADGQTKAEMGYPAQGHSIVMGAVTGSELENLLKQLVAQTDEAYQLPIVSGITMEIKQTENGFELTGLKVRGTELPPDDVFNFAYSDKAGRDVTNALQYVGGSEKFPAVEGKNLQSVWTEYLTEGNQPLAPSDYLVLSK